MLKTFVVLLTIALLSGCASDMKMPPRQCSYLEHETLPCSDAVVLSNDEGKHWSCKKPNPHYTAEDERCRWDRQK